MIPHTYDAVAGANFLAARVEALRSITVGRFKALEGDRKRIEEDVPMEVAEDLLTRG